MLGCSMLPRGCYSKACVSLVAKISCQVHLISWRDLAEVMKVYPEIKERILEEMELSCNLSSTKMVCAKMKFFSIELLIVALSQLHTITQVYNSFLCLVVIILFRKCL